MPKYHIPISWETVEYYEVEADNEDAAIEKLENSDNLAADFTLISRTEGDWEVSYYAEIKEIR